MRPFGDSVDVLTPRNNIREARYASLGTLGERSGAMTCSEFVAKTYNASGSIRKYPTFERAAKALKQGNISAMLVPGAYPGVFNFIQDVDLRCDRAFIMAIPPLVLAGRDKKAPSRAIALFHHPATAPMLKEVGVPYRRAIAVSSNAVAARLVVRARRRNALAVTNALCADYYRLTVYKVLRRGVEMPWIVFVSASQPFKNIA